ncbi:MAG: RNA methyltransferase [Smithellaceae bacterium]|nr:RNA methyltransferase [Smithellaceae bacterium]
MPDNLHIALLHYPAYNKRREVVATAVANMDIHDIARAARTYGIDRYYIVTPVESQRLFVERLLTHWRPGGAGEGYNPARSEALKTVHIRESLTQVVDELGSWSGRSVKTVATGANMSGNLISCSDLSRAIAEGGDDFLIIFGTGWGMTQETIAGADYRLEPLKGKAQYNHLSVRSAVAIIADRLCHVR